MPSETGIKIVKPGYIQEEDRIALAKLRERDRAKKRRGMWWDVAFALVIALWMGWLWAHHHSAPSYLFFAGWYSYRLYDKLSDAITERAT